MEDELEIWEEELGKLEKDLDNVSLDDLESLQEETALRRTVVGEQIVSEDRMIGFKS